MAIFGTGEVRIALLGGVMLGLAAASWGSVMPASAPAVSSGETLAARQFGLCHSGGGANCVVDGDTFWIDGTKIRIADIDAPETHPARCAGRRGWAMQRRCGCRRCSMAGQ